MLNEIRIDEIKCELRKIEKEQDEANLFMKDLILKEEEMYEEVRDSIRRLASSFEASHEDSRWTALVEERHHILLDAERCYNQLIDELIEDRIIMNAKYDSDIEELKHEMKILEGGELYG